MEWKEIGSTSNEPTWTLPSARSKNGQAHIVPLTSSAVEILSSMPRIAESLRVFESFSAAHAKSRLDEVMLEIAREDAAEAGNDPETAAIVPWRLHDIRRTAATKMAELKIDVGIVERVLNHQMRGVMAVYQRHSFIDEKRHALKVWADFLNHLAMTPKSNVATRLTTES